MSRHNRFENLSDEEARIRRRVAAKAGWFIHALVYVCVNAGLALLAWQSDRHVMAGPLLGWGLGLAIHGMAVWLKGGGLYQRLLQAERKRIQGATE